MSSTFARKLAVGFAIAVLALLVVGLASYRSTDYMIEKCKWVNHTYEIRATLSELLLQLTNAETGLFRYYAAGSRN